MSNALPISIAEALRILVRTVCPKRAYRECAEVLDWYAGIRILGLSQYRRLRDLRPNQVSKKALDEPAWFSIPTLQFPISVRPGTTDADEIIHSTLREAYSRWLPRDDVRFVIDAGANIGDTTAWYLSRFPDAFVCAVEPDAANFHRLRVNCEAYGQRAILLQRGLWHRSVPLTIVRSEMQSGLSVVEAPNHAGGDLLGITIEEIMTVAGRDVIDILKCDIEGAEQHVFSVSARHWLPRTHFVVIELHGTAAATAVFATMKACGFTARRYRDLYLFRNPALALTGPRETK